MVMTGMGSDGLKGSQLIHDAGGRIIIQDEASSVVWGMPGAIYGAGNADGIYPLGMLASEITRRVLESRKLQELSPLESVQNTPSSAR